MAREVTQAESRRLIKMLKKRYLAANKRQAKEDARRAKAQVLERTRYEKFLAEIDYHIGGLRHSIITPDTMAKMSGLMLARALLRAPEVGPVKVVETQKKKKRKLKR